ncbi:DUF1800 domain-containing protein [Nocardioides sp. TRM66260-LWL]|uniref:DUF1800 domain-containing protein n=1 Tax=Nocardioides sp. TRM66260-LWL TaxID=2874478 RepID=UPI001CC795D9|nr:DUF1800 domain-containing protein [Nocardioides sp. TRM66260-LWL]MBZ5734457.1 DUF1800 domain-containing protein [Nocardioides sp. TRM66260-LWL]
MSRYAPARYPATPILSTSARVLVSRFSFGLTPTLASEVLRAGGARAWWEKQIATAYDDPDGLAAEADWWPNQHYDAATIWQRQQAGTEGSWAVMANYGRRLLARRIVTRRQVLEVMTEFWESHFHVPLGADNVAFWRVPYGEEIRQRALGTFEDLLQAAVLHPAMLLFLGNAISTKAHPNENLGRELLELHTVGIGTYGEDDVKAAARILTGWRVDQWKTWNAYYSPRDHWTGPVQVMGFADANAATDGQDLTRRLLSYLAHHPATAERIARKLAQHFVSDTPSEALVARLAAVYLANDTAIVPVLRALISSPEFLGSAGRKLREPSADVVATYRALGATIKPPRIDSSAANQMLWQAKNVGLGPMEWPRPDGRPTDAQSWATPLRALASMEFHWQVAGGWWPGEDIVWRTPQQWLPRPRVSLRVLVDHLSRTIHGRPSTEGLLRSCCVATNLAPETVITKDHPLVQWGFPRLLGALLDHPNHYER